MTIVNDETLADPHDIPVVFVNEVAGTGFFNGVCNVTLSTCRFTPKGDEVFLDRIVAARLRMDLKCAMDLRDALNQIIEANTKAASVPAAAPAPEATGRPN